MVLKILTMKEIEEISASESGSSARSQTSGRKETDQQGSARVDLPYGGRKPNLG